MDVRARELMAYTWKLHAVCLLQEEKQVFLMVRVSWEQAVSTTVLLGLCGGFLSINGMQTLDGVRF